MKTVIGILILTLVVAAMGLFGIGVSQLIAHDPSSLMPADYFSGGLSLIVVTAMLHGMVIK